jgi:hypothetical protein
MYHKVDKLLINKTSADLDRLKENNRKNVFLFTVAFMYCGFQINNKEQFIKFYEKILWKIQLLDITTFLNIISFFIFFFSLFSSMVPIWGALSFIVTTMILRFVVHIRHSFVLWKAQKTGDLGHAKNPIIPKDTPINNHSNEDYENEDYENEYKNKYNDEDYD